MPIREAIASAEELFRIGRLPDPLAWPRWEYVGDSRFDDPLNRFRVLYAGERRACFQETLGDFRASLMAPEASGVVPAEWFETRRLVRFTVSDSSSRGLDLRAPETRQMLRRELAPFLVAHRYADLDASHVLSDDRDLTQEVTRWSYDRGFLGVVYGSRFDPLLTCWALFEGVAVTPAEVAEIPRDDPDLIAVTALFDLTVQ